MKNLRIVLLAVTAVLSVFSFATMLAVRPDQQSAVLDAARQRQEEPILSVAEPLETDTDAIAEEERIARMAADILADDEEFITRISSEVETSVPGYIAEYVQSDEFKALFDQIVALLRKYAEGGEVYVEGADKIFAYPEYRDVENVKGFLSVISQKDKLHELTQGDGVEITVKIGAEEGVKNMAVVSARYSLSGRQIGHVGVIGPERMDYKKVIKVLTTLGKLSEAKGKKEDGNG